MGLILVTPPSTTAVSLDEAKAQCRIDGTADDAVVAGMIAAATDYVEQYLGRSLMTQSWKLMLDGFSDEILLPRGPVTSITSFLYYDADNAQQTVDAALYTFDPGSDPQRIVRAPTATWPVVAAGINKVQVTYAAAYSIVPSAIKHALLLLIGQWFDNRSPLSAASRAAPEDSFIPELPHAVAALLSNYRSFAL